VEKDLYCSGKKKQSRTDQCHNAEVIIVNSAQWYSITQEMNNTDQHFAKYTDPTGRNKKYYMTFCHLMEP
jgi:hypothetical protein